MVVETAARSELAGPMVGPRCGVIRDEAVPKDRARSSRRRQPAQERLDEPSCAGLRVRNRPRRLGSRPTWDH